MSADWPVNSCYENMAFTLVLPYTGCDTLTDRSLHLFNAEFSVGRCRRGPWSQELGVGVGVGGLYPIQNCHH